MTSSSKNDKEYDRASIKISTHPGNLLRGKVVSFGTWGDISVDDSLLQPLVREANKRFDIDDYANDLRIGTIYIDAVTGEAIGVNWEIDPKPHNHGEFAEPVDELPEEMIPIQNILE